MTDHHRPEAPCCMHCGEIAALTKGREIYPHRKDLHDRNFWICRPCQAWSGCHRNTTNPLGPPADKPTRDARHRAHVAFDPLWQRKIARDGVSKKVARDAGYDWLARQMGLSRKDCHIGHMTAEQADQVTRICKELRQ